MKTITIRGLAIQFDDNSAAQEVDVARKVIGTINDILNQRGDVVSYAQIFGGDDISNSDIEVTETEIAVNWSQFYDAGECPDCGKPIPPDTNPGDDCTNCGHVFWASNTESD